MKKWVGILNNGRWDSTEGQLSSNYKFRVSLIDKLKFGPNHSCFIDPQHLNTCFWVCNLSGTSEKGRGSTEYKSKVCGLWKVPQTIMQVLHRTTAFWFLFVWGPYLAVLRTYSRICFVFKSYFWQTIMV